MSLLPIARPSSRSRTFPALQACCRSTDMRAIASSPKRQMSDKPFAGRIVRRRFYEMAIGGAMPFADERLERDRHALRRRKRYPRSQRRRKTRRAPGQDAAAFWPSLSTGTACLHDRRHLPHCERPSKQQDRRSPAMGLWPMYRRWRSNTWLKSSAYRSMRCRPHRYRARAPARRRPRPNTRQSVHRRLLSKMAIISEL